MPIAGMRALAVFAALALPAPAAAASVAQVPDLEDYDIDGDGRISRREAERHTMLSRRFADWDTDKSRYLESDELQAVREPRRSANTGTDRRRGKPTAAAGIRASAASGMTAPFEQLDLDGDDAVDRDEAGRDGFLAGNFELLDVNSDGALQRGEILYDPTRRPGDAGDNFDVIDVNDDGYLAPNEAARDKYVDAHFAEWDVNEDGVLDQDEVDSVWLEWDDSSFDALDANEDGVLEPGEVANVEFVAENFRKWDIDGDGFLTEDETNSNWLAAGDGEIYRDDVL